MAKYRAENAPDEPEKELLQGNIEAALRVLQEMWLNFPRDWKRENLHEVCQKSRYVWNMLDRLADIEKEERKTAAMAKAQTTWDSGFKFEKINMDGFAFIVDDGEVRETNDSDIPF